MKRTMILATLAVTLSGCALSPEQKAEQERYQALINTLPISDRLECEMHAQMAGAAASNPRAMIDLGAVFAANSMQSTCLNMKIARQRGI